MYLVVITAYRACKCVSIQSVCSLIANIVNILINIHVLLIKHHLRPPDAVNPLFDNPYPHTRTYTGLYNVAKGVLIFKDAIATSTTPDASNPTYSDSPRAWTDNALI